MLPNMYNTLGNFLHIFNEEFSTPEIGLLYYVN